MTLTRIIVVAAALMMAAQPVRAQGVRKLDITFNEGRVTLVAENVSLAEIFAEWGRKGGSKIVNAERLPSTPVFMTEFTNQPEADVLRTLLREAPGYGAAMRATAPAGVSTVQTVFILAVRATTSNSSVPPAAQQPPPSPNAAPRQIMGSPDDEIPPVRPISPEQAPMTPGMNPSMNPGNPSGNPGAPAGQATNPNLRMGPGGVVTSTVPGVPIPAPAKPNTGRGGGGGAR